MKKHILTSLALILIATVVTSCSKSKMEIMAVTGATPLAFAVDAPSGFSLTVDGMVKREYVFSAAALSAFPSTWLRTLEVSPDGKFQGTYAYTGIPLIALLEGIAPEKPKNAAFDRPLDMLVTFTSADGKKAVFSYGELTMTTDANPVILAYHRQEVLPSDEKTRKAYTYNMHKAPLTGLRLVSLADPDTGRCLDNVVKITLSEPTVNNEGIPPMVRGLKCSSSGLSGRWKGGWVAVSTAGVPRVKTEKWIRTGHGKGFKGISIVEGFSLRELLRRSFPGCNEKNYYLFIACDGYRVLISGRELFLQETGSSMMLIDKIDGAAPKNGPMLGPVKDYFVDRDVWGLSHIVVLDGIE